MRVGYVRVSTEEQNTARQEVIMAELGVDAMKELGLKPATFYRRVKVYEEKRTLYYIER